VAVLVRVMKDIEPVMLELQHMNLVYGQHQPDETHTMAQEFRLIYGTEF